MNDLRVPEKKFRPELEGVRVVAALLVAIYHIWLGSVSGGVDVFFIVSGYLITTSLLSRMERDGRIRFYEYYLGLMRRLIPNAYIVLLFCLVGAFILLPQTQWQQVISEIFASGFYFQNWELAFNSVDYLAQNNAASPLQHFWALSVQGQFYLTWPFIIFITFIIAKKVLKTPTRKTLLAILTILFVASISYSIYITTVNQPWAYFDTFARIWEFSLGGILALLIPYLNFSKLINLIIGWVGLIIILFTGIILPVSTVFPGYAALLPITGVILVIVSAENSHAFGVKRFLGSKPLLFIGGYSYAFYLWHWPLLIFYYAYFQTETVPYLHGLVIIIVAFVLSYLSTTIVEKPIRSLSVKQSKVKLSFIVLLFVIPIMGANMYWESYAEKKEQELLEQYNVDDYPGALVIYENAEVPDGVEPLTIPSGVESELPKFYSDGCYVQMDQDGLTMCSYGETDNPEYVVALVGGSHSGHWFPALEAITDDLNLRIDVYNKDACRFSTDLEGILTESCNDWNDLVLEELLKDPPDIIFTTSTVANEPKVPEGYIDMWKHFEGKSKIFAIRDNPIMSQDIPTCVELNGAAECEEPREGLLAEDNPWEVTEGLPEHVYFADLTEYFCDDDSCYAVVGNVLVYRDDNHISTLYSHTLANPLKDEFVRALEEWDM
ncbi:acyltransferase family protein [Gracilibacillus dipsosauri]|uniref:acyltransferase family protein n=1 Tax=Gracilibacillus dipsosauri TaxID=178340 RepID=UPI00240A10C4